MGTPFYEVSGEYAPVIVIRGAGQLDQSAQDALFAELEALAPRSCPSGLVGDFDRLAAPIRDAILVWFGTHRRGVGAGARVVKPELVEKNRRLIADNADKMPFPAWAAATETECIEWVQAALGECDDD